MPPPRPSRLTGFLIGLGTFVLVLGTVFCVVLVVDVISGNGPDGREVEVHTEVPARRVNPLRRGTELPDTVKVVVPVTASDNQLRWQAAVDLAGLVAFMFAVWLLREILQSVRAGDPFTTKNVGRLRTFALLALVGVPIAVALTSAIESAVAHHGGISSNGIQITMPGGALVGGVAALVLA